MIHFKSRFNRNTNAKCGSKNKDNPDENGIGELMAKGPNVMLGYYENEEETKRSNKERLATYRDLAYIDKDSYIFITGRKKNVIVLKMEKMCSQKN